MITRSEIDNSELARALATLSQQGIEAQIFSGGYKCISDVPDVPPVKLTSPAQLHNCVAIVSSQDDLLVAVVDDDNKVTQWDKEIMEDGSVKYGQRWSTNRGHLVVKIGDQAVCVRRELFAGETPPEEVQ